MRGGELGCLCAWDITVLVDTGILRAQNSLRMSIQNQPPLKKWEEHRRPQVYFSSTLDAFTWRNTWEGPDDRLFVCLAPGATLPLFSLVAGPLLLVLTEAGLLLVSLFSGHDGAGPLVLHLLRPKSNSSHYFRRKEKSWCRQHCTATAIPFIYPFSGNCVASAPIFTLMCLWAIYIFPGSVYIFPPAEQADPSWEYIISVTDTRKWKLGLRPRYSFSGNICFKFPAFFLCSVAGALQVKGRWESNINVWFPFM